MHKKTIFRITILLVLILPLNVFALTATTTYIQNGYLVSVYKGSTSQIWAEDGRGGHYYMKTPYSAIYDKAIGYANISSTTFNNAGGTKVPIYGFTVQTNNAYMVDFCVEYINGYWQTTVYSKELGASGTPGELYGLGGETYSGVGSVGMFEYISQTATSDVITCYFTYMSSDGTTIGQTKRTYTKPKGTLFTASTWNTVRWFRFMSLVPAPGYSDTHNDGSYFNGKWTSLSLHNKNTNAQVAWSFSASNVEEAWSVKYNNAKTTLSLDSSGQTDTFSINNTR